VGHLKGGKSLGAEIKKATLSKGVPERGKEGERNPSAAHLRSHPLRRKGGKKKGGKDFPLQMSVRKKKEKNAILFFLSSTWHGEKGKNGDLLRFLVGGRKGGKRSLHRLPVKGKEGIPFNLPSRREEKDLIILRFVPAGGEEKGASPS